MVEQQGSNPIVSIAGRISLGLIIMVALVVIFAKEEAWVLIPVGACFVLFGIILAHYASKTLVSAAPPKTKTK